MRGAWNPPRNSWTSRHGGLPGETRVEESVSSLSAVPPPLPLLRTGSRELVRVAGGGGFITREMGEMNLLDEREDRKVRLTSLALRWLWNNIDHQSARYGGQLGLVDAGWIEKVSLISYSLWYGY